MKFEVKIDEAIAMLEKNAREHDKELAEAIPEWTAQLKAAIDKFRDAVDRKALNASISELWNLHNSRPVDNRNQYATYLGGLRHSKEAGALVVQLDEDTYDQIFNDNWNWRQVSLTSNSTYSASAAAKLRS